MENKNKNEKSFFFGEMKSLLLNHFRIIITDCKDLFHPLVFAHPVKHLKVIKVLPARHKLTRRSLSITIIIQRA